MEEAERVADRIAVIDHGRIVVEGTAAALRQDTGGHTLEDALRPRRRRSSACV
jgi:ABC-2 type transport system ATP-binding protein